MNLLIVQYIIIIATIVVITIIATLIIVITQLIIAYSKGVEVNGPAQENFCDSDLAQAATSGTI